MYMSFRANRLPMAKGYCNGWGVFRVYMSFTPAVEMGVVLGIRIRIRIRIHRIHIFLSLLDPHLDPLDTSTDPDLDLSIIKQK